MAALMSAVAMADTKQTVTIGGTTVDKVVTKITFSGTQVNLTFADNTQQTEDMQQVVIGFEYPTAIGKPVTTQTEADKKVFNLNGQYLGTGLEGRAKGIYVVEGKKVVVK